jgi:hypothetical protein
VWQPGLGDVIVTSTAGPSASARHLPSRGRRRRLPRCDPTPYQLQAMRRLVQRHHVPRAGHLDEHEVAGATEGAACPVSSRRPANAKGGRQETPEGTVQTVIL